MKPTEINEQFPTFSVIRSNRLAPEAREILFDGLERVVNGGESEEGYRELSSVAADFFPARFGNNLHSEIAWHPSAWQLFRFYQGCLRKLWSGDFALQMGPTTRFLDGPYLNYLLGLDVEYSGRGPRGFTDLRSSAFAELPNAWATVLEAFPFASVERACVIPDWTSGQFFYHPINNFQTALQILFLESWRARICRRCHKYFIADKNAQAFCSTACSGGNRRDRFMKYWKEKGAKRRAARRHSRRKKK
jgi:hypothetical protein